MLTASITAYFSVLDLGYSGALVKFVAQYRAKRDYAGAQRDPEHDVRRLRHVRRRHLPRRDRHRAVPGPSLPPLARAAPRRPDRAADHQPQRRGRHGVQRLRRRHQRLPALRPEQRRRRREQRRDGRWSTWRCWRPATAWSSWSPPRRRSASLTYLDLPRQRLPRLPRPAHPRCRRSAASACAR